MDAMKNHQLHNMAQLLVTINLLDHNNAAIHQKAASNLAINFLQYITQNNILCPTLIASSIATHFDMPFVDLDTINISLLPLALVNETLIRRHRMLPISYQDNQLHVATDDPSQHDALKEIQFNTSLNVTFMIAETNKLTKLIHQLLHQKENDSLTEYVNTSNEIEPRVSDTNYIDKIEHSFDNEPVVRFVKRMLLDAVDQGASDIHFEPYENDYRIRYRQDGLLISIATPPHRLAHQISARIKILANLDTSERRIPQDGRFRINLKHNHAIDFRVSTCPTVCGEKIVVRVLDTQSTKPEIETLGFTEQQKMCFLQAISGPQGMILVTGPTGSGKTLTLYAALAMLNTGEKNISTAEDPVEINVHGINQVNINPKIGLTFAGTMRAFLRQDPDVIMIGEMRDLETAEIAVKAAQTGHLVLSTLHTNSACETLSRLMSMGVQTFNIASSVSLIIAQRLVRRLCETCKQQRQDLTHSYLLRLGLTDQLPLYQAKGCNHCTHGYRGRVALFEVMPISAQITQMIISRDSASNIFKQAQSEGMLTMYQAGIAHVKSGLTSLEEIHRVMID